jgi:hypothetical protein
MQLESNSQQHKKKKQGVSVKKEMALYSPSKNYIFLLGALTFITIAFGGWLLSPPIDPPVSDNFSEKKRAEILENFEKYGALEIKRIKDPKEIDQAIKTMYTSLELERQFKKKILAGEVEMAWMKAWDNAAEDGDVLLFESLGHRRMVFLRKSATTFALPLPKGEGQIKVTGLSNVGLLVDGITASIATTTLAVTLPVIRRGDSFLIHVR